MYTCYYVYVIYYSVTLKQQEFIQSNNARVAEVGRGGYLDNVLLSGYYFINSELVIFQNNFPMESVNHL